MGAGILHCLVLAMPHRLKRYLVQRCSIELLIERLNEGRLQISESLDRRVTFS